MTSRREFLTGMARGGILGLMVLFSGAMLRRWEKADGCRRSYACGNCGLSDNCNLPEAEKFRMDKSGPGKEKIDYGRDGK
ncbi:MAG: hypothetical protein WCO44_00860 [Bacteroidota bacterium]